MSTIKQQLAEAQEKKRKLEREIDDAKRDAIAEVHAQYEDRINSARADVRRLEKAWRDEIDASSSHPWDGKRVFRMVPTTLNRWTSKRGPDRRDDGIVEVVRQSSEFPANMRWGRPSLGTVIVRKLKKDKTPSLQFYDPTIGGDAPQAWQLAEGEQP